ncbi:Transcription factor 23 [Collichthys lucidus]|uniref:Transcription factor 23 n=1 Tax=Collichthys lucidus TaxID=240159 RepID=A0A4U5UMR5_COLLU|nr:Transcription factor 23 [Collichthys lucidus]
MKTDSTEVNSVLKSSASATASMAVNPLEGLMSVAVNHKLVSRSTADPQTQQPSAASSPASPHEHRQSVRSSCEPRKWVCGSRSNYGSDFGSKTLRGQHSPENAARERSRVRNLRQAFHSLQAALPSVPPDTKLSKLDVLVLATNYIAYLTETLDQGGTLAEHTLPSRQGGYLHPVKKWPMRSLLYCGSVGELLSGVPANQMSQLGQDGTYPLTPTLETGKE